MEKRETRTFSNAEIYFHLFLVFSTISRLPYYTRIRASLGATFNQTYFQH